MSRSVRKRPFAAYCGDSQKRDKRIGNRILRRTARIVTRVDDPDEAVYLTYNQAMNPWSMSQDGTRGYRRRRDHATMTDYGFFKWVWRK